MLIGLVYACIPTYIWRHFIFLTMAENNAILIYFNPTAPQLTRQSDTVHEARNEGRGFGRFRRARHTALSANGKCGRSRCCGCRKHSKDWFYHVLEIKSMIIFWKYSHDFGESQLDSRGYKHWSCFSRLVIQLGCY